MFDQNHSLALRTDYIFCNLVFEKRWTWTWTSMTPLLALDQLCVILDLDLKKKNTWTTLLSSD